MVIEIKVYNRTLGWDCEHWYLSELGTIKVQTEHIETVSKKDGREYNLLRKETYIKKRFLRKDIECTKIHRISLGVIRLYRVAMVSGEVFYTKEDPFSVEEV